MNIAYNLLASIIEYKNKIEEETQKKADNIILEAKNIASNLAVTEFNKPFREQEKIHAKAARCWFWGAIGSTVIGLLILIALFWVTLKFPQLSEKLTRFQYLELAAIKTFIVVVVFTAINWCLKMYRASKHSQIMYGQKANALGSFQVFVNSAVDPTIRDAILMETTKSIFSLTNSGFLDKNNQASDNSIKLIEIIKPLIQGKGS